MQSLRDFLKGTIRTLFSSSEDSPPSFSPSEKTSQTFTNNCEKVQPGSSSSPETISQTTTNQSRDDKPSYAVQYSTTTPSSIYQTAALLRLLPLPAELIPQILDLAESWHCVTSVSSQASGVVNERNSGTVYIAAGLPASVAPISLRYINFTVRSHDQGWSSYPSDQGTYNGSWTWYEAAVIERETYERATSDARGSNSINLKTEGHRIITNIHASRKSKEHIVTWRLDDENETIRQTVLTLKEDPKEKMIALIACARYPGWSNYVQFGKIEFGYLPVRKM